MQQSAFCLRKPSLLFGRSFCSPVSSRIQEKLKELGLKEASVLPVVPASPSTSLDQLRKYLTDADDLGTSRMLDDKHNRYHNYLRISLTERCNLRCTYCMPAEGVELSPSSEIMSTEEIITLVRLFAEEGVNKIRFTGGEPLVRKDIEEIITRVHEIPGIESIGVTTNGIVLPRKLEKLKTAGLNQLNISLDTLNAEKFTEITRRNGFNRVMESIDKAISLGFTPLKVNCVVMRGMNEKEVVQFVDFTKEKAVDIRFIEYMPFDGNAWNDKKLVPYKEMMANIKEKYPDIVKVQNSPNDTSKSWQIPGHQGILSFITSMTEHFCDSCNRVRLTADGNLKVCLFGSAEVSLRDALRNDDFTDQDIKKIIGYAIGRKKVSHAGMYNIANMKNRPMILIGG